MKCKIFTPLVLLATSVSVLAQSANAALIVNGGFESPVVAGDKMYTPTEAESGWVFVSNSSSGTTGESGILSANAAGLWGAANADGQSAVFFGTGTIAQTISGLNAGTAAFTFSVRKNVGATSDVLTVTLDGTALTFSGTASVAPDNVMRQYTSDAIMVAAGAHTLQFQANAWSHMDNVSVSGTAVPTPEPTAIVLLATGLLGLLAYAWRNRK